MAGKCCRGTHDPFGVRAYRNAARSATEFGRDIKTLPERGEELPKLPGFGEKTEQHILQLLEAQAKKSRRFKLAVATQYADALVAYLKKARGVKQAVIA